jgi:hypothetical protein
MRFLRMFGLALPLMAAATGPAFAQAVPPLGRWASQTGNVLVVNDDATCAYQTPQLRVQGGCSWHGAGAADGVLVIDYAGSGQSPQRIDVSIHWINRQRITVLGEQFQRR